MARNQLPSLTAGASGGPIEYKDAPIRFTFMVDGREEPVKIVEPEIDLPFPDGVRLLVDEGERRLCEVVFRFDMEARQPYRLHVRFLRESGSDDDLHLAYGAGVAPESDMREVYRKTILERGNVRARIEMTQRKARLQLRYRPGGPLRP